MVVLTALYKTPGDAAAFDTHYNDVHTPLIKKIPGLRKLEVIRYGKMLTPATAMLAEQPYLQCNMYFDNKDAFKAAMASEENKAAGADLMSFAGTLVSMCTGNADNIELQ
ncbi:MAG TPA: EthD family reductase [Candidatus Kapabacteria bacterium]|nr:EthD family reductase [Candidatus Kapabacteria bacterium]